jgi:hypothetical protein
MIPEALPPAGAAELAAAAGGPFRPIPLEYGPDRGWDPIRDGQLLAAYTYADAQDNPTFQVLRFHVHPGHPAHPDKAFLSRRWTRSGWRWGLEGAQLVLYRLSRVLDSARGGRRIYVVEGEKDAESLQKLGLVATCNPLGALQWIDRYALDLAGADVIVLPDNDRVGHAHAALVAESLRGRAGSVAVLLLPELAPKEDVSDWLDRGNTVHELERLASAAPRDLDGRAVAATLGLPQAVDPADLSPTTLRALLGAPPVSSGSVPPFQALNRVPAAFRTTLALFGRLGLETASIQGPTPHTTYRNVTAAVRAAEPERRDVLDDASRLERTCHEMLVFTRLLQALDDRQQKNQPRAPAWMIPAAVRLETTEWDWDAYFADRSMRAPRRRPVQYALQLAESGLVRVIRLQTLPALVLEACTKPRRDGELARIISAAVDLSEFDGSGVSALVSRQTDELARAGLLVAVPRDHRGEVRTEMHTLLTSTALQLSAGRRAAGVLVRAYASARGQAERVRTASLQGEVPPYEGYLLDLSVDGLQYAISNLGAGAAFSDELDGYWKAPRSEQRVQHIGFLLDVLGRMLGSSRRGVPPLLLA